MTLISYWAFIGLTYILYLTYQDYKHNRMVDDRKNSFMLGVTVSLVAYSSSTLLYKLLLSVLLFILRIFMLKVKAIGEADINTLSWVLLGFGLISPFAAIFALISFAVLISMFLFMKLVIFKYKAPVQFYGVILVTYILTCYFMGIY